MESFIGVKIINAEAMDEKTFYENFRGAPRNDGPTSSGFHVVYANPSGEDYHSWSPLDVFEHAYRRVTDGEIKLILTLLPEPDSDQNVRGE
ncbi:hypothetical protein LCGC14_0937990 [marine sediment metagenome]|uniref:Uncharacterized protein n=1 Tax=marine sediment metagenome TaxID=412755 RepID=A0A0F9P735_9ZZZZ|nr:hypothetical protein [Pricia sp.]